MLTPTDTKDGGEFFEPSSVTDSLGGFTLNVFARNSASFAKVIIKTYSNEGCVDSFSKTKPGMLALRAPMHASVITPLTTVAVEIASVYLITVERAAELILESLGLTEESIDSDLIFNVDPFQKLVIDGDDSLATVAYASVNLANAISMVSSLLHGAGTSSKTEAEAATLSAFAKRIGETNLVLRKKRRMLLGEYHSKSFLNMSDSSDISSIISSAVSLVSRTSPDVRVDTETKNTVARASAMASSYLLSAVSNTTSNNSGEEISKRCAASVKVMQDPELLEAVVDLGKEKSAATTSIITDLEFAYSEKFETAKASVLVLIPEYPPPPSPPSLPPPSTPALTFEISGATALLNHVTWTIWLSFTLALAASWREK